MDDTVKRLAILGSTGSIGRQTLDIVRSLSDKFKVVALAAGNNLALLTEQINEFKPNFVHHQSKEKNLKQADTTYEFLSPEEIAAHPQVDLVIIAVSGRIGLLPALAAIKAGNNIALANKESLVMAGELIIRETEKHNASILPIDSEHSAIWQCLSGEIQPPARIILTASGGPFRRYSPEELDKVTAEQALRHPSWKMGKKVTIDSATLMNKGLEVIEARWLFNMPFENIKILIHPQSIIHSMVEFVDGSVKAQLSLPDMRLPIQYALSYPERLPNPQLPKVNWNDFKDLNFEQPDYEKFPCLKLAIEAGKKGGTYPAVLCSADETAVELFLSGNIRFTDILRIIEITLEKHKSVPDPGLEDILAVDSWAREKVLQLVKGERK